MNKQFIFCCFTTWDGVDWTCGITMTSWCVAVRTGWQCCWVALACVCVCVPGYVQLDAEMRNLSRHQDDTARLRCDITGFPLPTYRWYSDGRPLTPVTSSSSARLDIRTTPWGSRSQRFTHFYRVDLLTYLSHWQEFIAACLLVDFEFDVVSTTHDDKIWNNTFRASHFVYNSWQHRRSVRWRS